MGCYHPIHGFMRQDASGRKFTMSSPRSGADYVPQTIPCGQCVGCRLDRSRSWAIRCMHEASLYECNSFITLTYAPEHLPPGGSLVYVDFQKFMKRLRFSYMGHQPVADGTRPIRFYMAGEYGELKARPHFHACLFNFDFPDRRLHTTTGSGSKIYTSAILEELWPFGFSSVGDVTFQSAAYVARYIMKKVTGKASASHYEVFDSSTGEVFDRVPEFNKMSLKPGIGAGWYDKFKSDVYPHDYVVLANGKRAKPPRFYDNKFRTESPYEWDSIEYERFLNSQSRRADSTSSRLQVRETLAIRQLSMLKRKL